MACLPFLNSGTDASAPQTDAQLLMPVLGQALEPAHTEKVKAWWREVDVVVNKKVDAWQKSVIGRKDYVIADGIRVAPAIQLLMSLT